MATQDEAQTKRCASVRFPGVGSAPMSTRANSAKARRIPKLGCHSSGQARVTLNGKVHYCGSWGTAEAHARYAELIRAWQDRGEQPAADRRAALAELQSTGLVTVSVTASGPLGGRPRETWTLRYPGSSAVKVAQQKVRAAQESRQRTHRYQPWKPPPPVRGRRRGRRIKPVPGDVADEICDWIASGRFLRDYCRRPEAPAARTVYAWAKKDRGFRRRFQHARDFGEWMIREEFAEHLLGPGALAALGGDRAARREFNLRYIRPIDLRLQRWRKHSRRRVHMNVLPS